MASEIIRTAEEIEDAAMRAQQASFQAEDRGRYFPQADAIYTFWQWMTGNSGEDPTAEFAEGDGDE